MNRHIYVVFSAVFCMAAQTICPALAAPAPIGSDDFNDNSRLTANWGTTTLAGAGQFLENNQRLEYTTVGTPGAGDFAAWDWNRYGGTDNQSWTFQIDVSMPELTLPNSGQRVLFGLQVPMTSGTFFVYVNEANSGGIQTRDFIGQLDSSSPSSSSAPATSDLTALQLRFDGASGDLSAYYDPNGPGGGYRWTRLFDAPGFGADTISVFGQSDDVALVSSDNVFGDNVLAAPEPSTYALTFLGLGLLGGVVHRRSRHLRS